MKTVAFGVLYGLIAIKLANSVPAVRDLVS
jgi:DNA polymerase I-like protein with 3'-5' exonuclease and polymerase domains